MKRNATKLEQETLFPN